MNSTEQDMVGTFIGLLPFSREFEFRLADSGEIIDGDVAAAVQDIGQISKRLGQTVQIRVVQSRIGNGRPRYLLLGLPEWPA